MKGNTSEEIFPSGFRYWDTEWYQTMIGDIEKYRYRILLFSFGIGMVIPILMLFNDVVSTDYTYLLNHILPLVALILIYIYLIKSKNIRKGTSIALITAIIGFILSLLLPGGNLSYFLTFAVFPALAFQIKGLKKGRQWSVSYFIFGILSFMAVKAEFVKTWANNLSILQIALAVIIYALLFIISYVGEKQHEKYLQKFLKRINFDPVTGLPNREVLLNSISSYGKDIFVILRIINFNDLISLFGYELSDNIIRFAGTQVKNLNNEFSIKGFKLLSNDFGIIFSEKIKDQFEIKMRLKEFIRKLESVNMKWGDKDINLIYGIGACEINHQSLNKLLSNADQSLKEGLSENSKVNFYVENSSEKMRSLDSLTKFSKLVEGRDSGGFLTVFQPVLNANSQNLEWYEALMRIKNGDRYESIYSYLEIAKSTGFYGYITDFILKSACDFIKTTGNRVSINISVIDILNPLFFYILEKNTSVERGCSSKLILEIVETEEMKDQVKILNFIEKAKKIGCQVAIDDFGSGYSNFVNLINLPFDIVKVDGELIKKIAIDSDALAMLESIVEFCKKTGKRVVAEYVENYEIYEKVKELGIDYVQGYYFGKPESIEDMKEIIKSINMNLNI